VGALDQRLKDIETGLRDENFNEKPSSAEKRSNRLIQSQ